jgi:SagB-type dehydrogenase family enzyme
MKRGLAVLFVLLTTGLGCSDPESNQTEIRLPEPRLIGDLAVESALETRRSVRHYTKEATEVSQISQLMWSAQGITRERDHVRGGGFRTAPSAGALYPLELYVVAGEVSRLPAGIYHYLPSQHSLVTIKSGDYREQLAAAALGQQWVEDAPVAIVVTGIPERTAGKYGKRAQRYVHIECGAVCQNIYLQSEALELGTVLVGAFQDDRVATLLDLKPGESPLAIMPVGHPNPDQHE